MQNSIMSFMASYASIIVEFLASDPVIYFTGAFLILVFVKIIKSLSRV